MAKQPRDGEAKGKMRLFGCTWVENITKGQARDAIDECVRQFPEKNAEYYNRPATEDQLAKLQSYPNEHPDTDPAETLPYDPDQPLSYQEAKDLIDNWEHFEVMEEKEKQLAYFDSEDFKMDMELSHINHFYEDEHREVTRDEIAKAWALVKSRRPGKPTELSDSESPNMNELMDALEELFSDFKPKTPDPSILAAALPRENQSSAPKHHRLQLLIVTSIHRRRYNSNYCSVSTL